MGNSVGQSVVMSQIRGPNAERASTTLKYESDTIVVTKDSVNYDLKDNSTHLWARINVTRNITVRINGGSAAIRLNAITEDAIDLLDGESYDMDEFPITNIYVTTGAENDVTVRVVMVGWN